MTTLTSLGAMQVVINYDPPATIISVHDTEGQELVLSDAEMDHIKWFVGQFLSNDVKDYIKWYIGRLQSKPATVDPQDAIRRALHYLDNNAPGKAREELLAAIYKKG
jgi:hypothetical protein